MRRSENTVECEIHRLMLPNGDRDTAGIRAICTRCDHETESFGTRGASVRRCLLLMRQECPRSEENFYKADDESDQEDKR